MTGDRPESYSLTMGFKIKMDGKKIKSMKTTWALAADMPYRTCGKITRRMCPKVKHSVEASCSRKCDPPIQTADSLREITGTERG